jgi:hypothetical protein
MNASVGFPSEVWIEHHFRFVIDVLSESLISFSHSIRVMVVSLLYYSIVRWVLYQTDCTSESNAASLSTTFSTTFSFLPE